MSTELAVQTTTELVIAPEQTQFTDTQLSALKQIGVDNAPAGDIAVFFHQAKRTGLDPFAKQIYMIGRRTKVGNSYETKYTIQTGIDGYRLNVRRAAERGGDSLAVDGPYWRGETGGWDDVWLDKNTPPSAAKFTIIRNGEPFTGIAMFHEYVQTYWDNESKSHVPNSMWTKMPANQLAKCAEAAACRRAYPDDFSGLVLEDAVQIIDETGATVVRSERGGRGVASLRARAQDAQVVTPDPETEPKPEKEFAFTPATRKKWQDRMFVLLGEGDCKDRDAQVVVISKLADRDDLVEHRDELTDIELRDVVNELHEKKKAGKITDLITSIIEAHVNEQLANEEPIDPAAGADGGEGQPA